MKYCLIIVLFGVNLTATFYEFSVGIKVLLRFEESRFGKSFYKKL